MASLNRAQIIGRLGQDPDMRATTSGKSVTQLSVATSEKYKDQSGQLQESTTWHRVVAWGKLAEICNQYCRKGQEVYVEGRLQTRSYEKDGVKRYVTEIVASNVQFLGSKNETESMDSADDDSGFPF